MTKLQATLELHVPAVLGGARPRSCDPYFKLRPSSVRGGLRYWFRAAVAAVLWPDHGEDARAQDEADAQMLECMRKLEAQVFGDTAQRSRVIVLPPKGGFIDRWPIPSPNKHPGLRYLGYGLFEKGRDPERLCTRPGRGIELELHLRDDNPKLRAAVAASLWLWTSFGGLGSRGRRGFGSMYLATLRGEDGASAFGDLCALQPMTETYLQQVGRGFQMAQAAVETLILHCDKNHEKELKDLKQLAAALLEKSHVRRRPHPHVRTLAGIANLKALNEPSLCDDPLDALDYAGVLFRDFRSSIKRSRPLPDYNHVKNSLKPPYNPPPSVDRAVFGLPLNFCFRSLENAKAQFVPQTPEGMAASKRLGSPLLFRVYALRGKRGRRKYGVALINLAEAQHSAPLLGCEIRNRRDGSIIEPSSSALIDRFVAEALERSKQAPRRNSRRNKRSRR